MINSTASGNERDQGARRPPEPPVDIDACGERQHPRGDSGAQTRDRPRPVALQGEDVLAGPKDRLDPLADRGEVGAAPGLVLAGGAKHGRTEGADLVLEVGAGVALVADYGLATTKGRGEQRRGHLTLGDVRGSERPGARRPVGAEDTVQAHPPEVPRMAWAVTVRAPGCERRASRGLDRAPALDRRGVDEDEVVV